VDLERYPDSALVGMFPSGATWLSARSGMEHVRQLITVMNGNRGRLPLLVLIGALAQRESAEDAEFGSMVRLDASTVIMGDPEHVRAAAARWRQEDLATADIAATADRLSGSYDLWFVAVRPLDLDRVETDKVLKYRDDLVQVVEEARGGVRLGSFNDVNFEVVARSTDDAAKLAALAQWLPGFIQLQEQAGPMGSLVGVAENLSVRTSGRTAVMSFSVAETALQQVTKARHGPGF
jgi:hypothetical protein